MRAFIHGFQGKPYNIDCQAAYDGFQKLGIEPILFTTNEEFDTREPEDVVVGGTIMIWHALNQRGITAEHFDYPEELSDFRGRRIWTTQLKDINEEMLPVFIKPVEEKIAPGIVVESMEELKEEYGLLDPETGLYCSDPVEFVSEWRCFLLCGLIVGIQFYYGDRDEKYDRAVIDAAVKAYPNMPAGCALDFGVTDDGRTLLIEMNDGYSLGVYGLKPTLYARLLAARWAELNNTVNPISLKGKVRQEDFDFLMEAVVEYEPYPLDVYNEMSSYDDEPSHVGDFRYAASIYLQALMNMGFLEDEVSPWKNKHYIPNR